MEQRPSHPPVCQSPLLSLSTLLHCCPQAAACLSGGEDHPGLSGTVRFYRTVPGILVWAEVHGLPCAQAPCQSRVFGFHIHEGTDCGGTMAEPFSGAMSHFDTSDCRHPHHAGDLPPLFGTGGGCALSLFLTDRFTVQEVIGRTVIIHDQPDDFTTQPAGNAGRRIACGVIRRCG